MKHFVAPPPRDNRLRMYVLYDRIAEVSMTPPYPTTNDAAAVKWAVEILHIRSPLPPEHSDYQLLHVGYYDSLNCRLEALDQPLVIDLPPRKD